MTPASENADLMTCECAPGTLTARQLVCNTCNRLCAVCNTLLNVDCDMCAQGAYKIHQSTCVRRCPEPYIEDDDNRICTFDQSLLDVSTPPVDPKGCMDGYFYDFQAKNCTQCQGNCLTCELEQTRCTSCPNGRYLTAGNVCALCDTVLSDSMITGSSGACIEVCGDGKNFGNEMCDDGNLEDGDGCSSTCEVEPDYQCSGGYPYKRDTCQYIRTEIVEVKVNKHNDLILKFSRPIQSRDGTISERRDFALSYRNQYGVWQYLSY